MHWTTDMCIQIFGRKTSFRDQTGGQGVHGRIILKLNKTQNRVGRWTGLIRFRIMTIDRYQKLRNFLPAYAHFSILQRPLLNR